MKWNSICFDLDNTLFSHEQAFKRAISECYNSLLATINKGTNVSGSSFETFFPIFKRNSDRYWALYENKNVTAQHYRRLRFMETIKEMDLPFTEKEADWFHEKYYNIVDEYSVPYDGLHELLQYLSKIGVTLGIITNGTIDTQYNKLRKLGITQWIPESNMIVSEEAGIAKPDPEIFILAEKTFSLTSPKLFVGDSWKHDVAGASGAGWDSLFLNTRGENRGAEHQPVAVCETFSEASQTIREQLKEGGM
ncbi:HAD family hydrolase [Alteribacter populi]|uniref:HAD family hydrolase n=1 Tax=Alteribacter populi TaxID=2011011 RepID=UPI000BBA6132|nr:HAD-IA family hydrolase [Alteribacter populi]